MNQELLIAERLSPVRLILRGLGAAVVLGVLIAFAWWVLMLANGVSLRLPWLAWAQQHPIAGISLAVMVACPLCFGVICLTWLPTRRKFRFDRASAYALVGRFKVRHKLQDVEILSGPPRLLIAGQEHHISHHDWNRLTSFYRALAHERERHVQVRPMAMGQPVATRPASLLSPQR